MSNPLELVRVKDPDTGTESSRTRQYAKTAGWTVLEGKPTHRNGQPIPTKTAPLFKAPAAPTRTATPATKKTGKTAEKES